ncbi:ABC transporter permease [Rhodovulum sp. BSW8]|uniref:ABC transporter permease n=1 Tax=Rhodovulum sp. BSW8 TaxID=2259645 RepID=UPI000DE51629|nr:ABC transporter permease [Rhodovulum sp. BSW8]RBO53430.1 ABC transporter permease [Rhodovulum sp. BSW8]
MLRFLLRRLLMLGPVLVGLTAIMFVIARLLPGDPVGLAAGPNATLAERAALAQEFGLDRPVWDQYLSYVAGLARGDLGRSLMTRRPVAEDIAIYLPATLELVLAAMALAIALGLPLGLLTALWQNRWPDRLGQVLAIGAISVPRFFLGLLLQLVFAMWLMWLPLGGQLPVVTLPPPRVTGLVTLDAALAGDWATLGAACRHLALPALALALSPLAAILRMMRASAIEVMAQDYVTAARALGLPRRKILIKTIGRNAVSATLTVIGLYVGWLLGGTVLVETVFDWPGLGLYATRAILSQDMMPVIGVALVTGLIFIAVNLAVDLAYGLIDPRVRYE